MRKLLFAFLLLLFLFGNASAAINVQDSLAANSVLSFNVSLPSAGSFREAVIFLDSDELIGVYTFQNKVKIDEDSINKTKVVSSAVVDNVVYLSIASLKSGSHTVKLQVDGAETESREITVFEPLDSGQIAEMQKGLSGLRGTANALEERLNALQADSLKKEDKDQLLAEIDSLKGKLDSMQSSLDSVAADESQNKESIDGLVAETQALKQQAAKLNETMESGFFGLGKSWQGIGLIAALLIAAIIVIAVAYSKRHLFHFKRSLYGKRIGSDDLGEALGEDGGGLAAAGLAAEAKPGKWALEKPVEEKSRRFHFGDLIKK
jgi:hypothetical protein